MARGKAAAQAANRRTRGAVDRIAELEALLSAERSARRKETVALQAELAAVRSSILREAGRLAEEDIKRKEAQAQRATASSGMSRDIVWNSMYNKDKFILNACRYLSITEGIPPAAAICRVITWATDEDFYGFGADPFSWVAKLGVPPDGWTARLCRTVMRHLSARKTHALRAAGTPYATNLDSVERDPEGFSVHPKYRSSWYPEFKYRNQLIVEDGREDDDGETA